MSSLSELDSSLRNYIALVTKYIDEYLASPGLFDNAIFCLLEAPFFSSHLDRMTANVISTISPDASYSSLFISLMIILHLGLADPLAASTMILRADPTRSGTSRVFRAMRARWQGVVPILLKAVWDAGVVEHDHAVSKPYGAEVQSSLGSHQRWEVRVGTAATAVLYEICRVQKLEASELSAYHNFLRNMCAYACQLKTLGHAAVFSYDFIDHLFALVERTRDVEDETFNYTLIKLIIALNEQFMVASLSSQVQSKGGNGALPPPILPQIVGDRQPERGPNLVLEALKARTSESKTFGENVIFILNRSNGTPDSLCVSLLILKLLYLLFTTTGMQEYFYTNDLCVLVDVFIRELCDLDEESEGLKHTYLRVLHPLLSNTQLRHHPYKRPQLLRVLLSLISNSSYREIDPTTRRLVERNLRGSWCDGLEQDRDRLGLEASHSPHGRAARIARFQQLDDARSGLSTANSSSISVDAIARAEQAGGTYKNHFSSHRIFNVTSTAPLHPAELVADAPNPPEAPPSMPPALPEIVTQPTSHDHLRSVPSVRSDSLESLTLHRRRKAPPPPSERSNAVILDACMSPTTPTSQRRAAPDPPLKSRTPTALPVGPASPHQKH
ncbi:BZ3500_MvSof-1268-A1-R1_Chr10-2g02876 [Microbotryum saponariae]|uniref:BZ3500_MvSof-1268-A1-R1_Chr10-2g02876 protein n=1 Tax=Microbotryum saponariae TaxID=289078 RepID=A0A2X0M257_9BASI|nr:BZ3501_MvSof-1269-A2-R1_Chr10-2g02462 [Microbotryum saponariae]SDA01655.1 BZ3500_MvSof-1268-A1-R1_Chr10-2g02876 [Microbotryum saponariae]